MIVLLDTQKLRDAVKHFKFHSTPSSGTGSHPCTVDDLRKVIKKFAELMNTFIDEIENQDH